MSSSDQTRADSHTQTHNPAPPQRADEPTRHQPMTPEAGAEGRKDQSRSTADPADEQSAKSDHTPESAPADRPQPGTPPSSPDSAGDGPSPTTVQPDAPSAPSKPRAPATPPSATEPPPVPTSRDAPKLSAEVEAEFEQAMAELEAEQPKPEPSRTPGIRGPRVVEAGRERRTGAVVSVGPTDIFVEFGPKELGVVPRAQWPEGDKDLPEVGQELEVIVVKYEPDESIFMCARPGTVTKADWELLEPGQTVEARVTGANKGGLELEIAGHRAFMPASHVALERINDLSVFVGEKLTCIVQRVDRRGAGNIVLSRRDMLREERERKKAEMRDIVKPGMTMEGAVRKIMPFGAFVDLGGIDGLVHISELSHERVGFGEQAVAKFVREGQQVKVQVLEADFEQNRISLSLKALESDPFEAAIGDLSEGDEITGKVKNTTEFGAFVEIAPGIEGLVHISQLAYRRVDKVEDVVKSGDEVKAKLLSIDRDSRKISLSIKALQEPPQGGGGRGRGGKRDDQFVPEPVKETPAMRRMREKAKQREKAKGGGLGGLGGGGIDLGQGLGDLKL